MATPYQPDVQAVGDSIFLTAMVSIIPLLVVFVFLGVLKTKAHIAGLAGLASAILVAVLAFGMPIGLSLLAASQGIVYGLFPIMWIVLAAIWLYELTVISGRFEDLRLLKQVADYPARHASTLVSIEATLEAVDNALTARTRLAGAA